MLMAHAYAFANNMEYGGACGDEHKKYEHLTRKLMNDTGLDSVIRFACPADEKAPIFDRKVYFAENSRIWTKEYLEFLHEKVHYPKTNYSVVIHIRRGDVTPCGKYSNRYLPNSHFLDILRKHVPRNLPVSVFSVSKAYERWDDFTEKGHSVHLDTELSEVWKAIMTADYVVLSKSSFSFIPAMLNPAAKVIYTPFMVKNLPGWEVVRPGIINRTKKRVDEMKKHCEDDETAHD
jgi:hypothetical protein